MLCFVLFFILVLPGCKEDMRDLYEKAMKTYRAEDYEKAAELFEVILEKYPAHDLSRKARYELGNIYFYKLKQPHKALKHLQDLYAQSQPGKYSFEALKLLGYIYDKSLNDCLKGVDVYRMLIRDYPSEIDPGEYQQAIAECYFKLHDYDQACLEYEALLEQYPESRYVPRSKFQIANSYALREDWERAITLYEELLLSESLSEQLLIETKLELAFCYEHQQQFEDALELYVELQDVVSHSTVIDIDVLMRKIERVQESIAESKKSPSEVDWSRK
ncbi:putative TPR repeat lipoprotein [Candidatus Vecturithrix granuli]|uniref:Putative TPR repeat lipoprotein n=1 Tax=Vecturithrix granuli TaxID=1499967 RepID=A0A0S6W6V5_VECG1|nr:putative TPR repeat lipoprotein [Candidatus Vecturithrix granuli]